MLTVSQVQEWEQVFVGAGVDFCVGVDDNLGVGSSSVDSFVAEQLKKQWTETRNGIVVSDKSITMRARLRIISKDKTYVLELR